MRTDLAPSCKDAPQRAHRLKAGEQHRAFIAPQPVLQPVPNASGIAHARCGNDDVKPLDPVKCDALFPRFGEMQVP
jgi:hypothetical protein